ncbi:MAG: c-type cytochrome [Pseudomonadota bacterium]
MSQQDDIFYRNFGVVLGILTVITLFLIIFSNSDYLLGSEEDSEAEAAATAARIKPVGNINTGEVTEEAPAAVAQTPEEIYNGVCSVCHIAGVSDAPKPDDTAAWSSRYNEKGFDGLVNSVITGLNAMPPRAGRADLSDDDIKATVEFMLTNAGVDVSGDAAATAPAVETAAPVAEAPAEQPAEVPTEQPAAPAAGPAEAAVETVKQAAETAAAATTEATDAVAQAAEQVAEKAEAATATASAAVSLDGFDLAQGESTYRKACFACHDAGVAGAPKIGDAATWGDRLAKGVEALTQSSLKGLGGMPPKGGHMYLSDEEVKNGVAYMVSKSVK